MITPLLGYTRNVYQGPGTTTYHVGGNEYLLNEQIQSIDQLYRIGLAFNYGPVQAGSRRAGESTTGRASRPFPPEPAAATSALPSSARTQRQRHRRHQSNKIKPRSPTPGSPGNSLDA